MRLTPPDPRKYLPSKAHPEHRQQRKQLEKEAAVGLTEVAALGLIGLTLAWDIEKQVQKHEEKKDKEEAERKRREEREARRGRGKSAHGSLSSRDYTTSRGGRSSGGDPRRHQSVDYRADPRYDDRYREREREQKPRPKDPRDNRQPNYRRYEGRYDDPRDLDRSERGRSRRDSY